MSLSQSIAGPVPDEAAFAARFQPLLFLDSGERWRPISVESMVDDGQVDLCEPGSACTRVTSLQQIADSAGGRLDLSGTVWRPASYHSNQKQCVSGILLDCDDGPTARLYYHIVPHGGYLYIDYWDYFRFNDPPAGTQLFDSHESDWEGLVVAVTATDPDPATFSFVEFAAHNGVYRYLRSALLCGRSVPVACSGEAERVRAYVARGTHATYPEPCAGTAGYCIQNGLPWIESSFDGAKKWGANDQATALEPFPTVGWPSWTGNWDSFPSYYPGWEPAVHSPGTQRRFRNPWDAQCVSRWSGRPEPGDCLARSTGPQDPCASWAGPFTTAVVCDPEALSAALATGSLQPAVSKVEPVAGSRISAVQGLTQVLGPPLTPGQTLTLRSAHQISPYTRVYARIENGPYTLFAGFDETGLALTGTAQLQAGVDPQGKPTARIMPVSVRGVLPIAPITPTPRLSRLVTSP